MIQKIPPKTQAAVVSSSGSSNSVIPPKTTINLRCRVRLNAAADVLPSDTFAADTAPASTPRWAQNFDSVSTRRRDGWLCEASEASAILRRTEKAAPASSLCPQLNSRPTTFGPRLPPILSPTTHLEEMHVRRRVAP